MVDRDFSSSYGPVALVTGASSGIGRAFARLLAARGLDLVLVARRTERLDALAAELKSAHGTTTTVLSIDLADPGAPARILDATAAIDIGLVVSNAGFGAKGHHGRIDAQLLADIVTVNSATPSLLAHGYIPRLLARGKGGLIFVSSVEGLIGSPFSAAYGASKAFVNSLGEALWAELTPQGLDVLTICPGATDTEAAAKQGVDPASMTAVMAPDEVAEFALAHLRNGPVLVSSDHYRQVFAHLTAMPRREALAAMAKTIKSSILKE